MNSLLDEACCFLNIEGAGELPHDVVVQLRPKTAASAIYITRFDKTRLAKLVRAHETRDVAEDLAREIARGTEVDSSAIAPDVVTMNSTIRVTDLDSGAMRVCTIVFPADADLERGRISILSPLGTAVLGFRAGDIVRWETPRETRRLRIDELIYQPEAAGDFHL